MPHDETWPEIFRTEHDALAAALGPACLAIHHVGSTSVPGLPAKPVIDAARYGDLKTTLAQLHVRNPAAHQAAKADFIDEIHARAIEWDRQQP